MERKKKTDHDEAIHSSPETDPENIFLWNTLNEKQNVINNITLPDYINSDNNLEIKDHETNEKIIADVQKTSESVEY